MTPWHTVSGAILDVLLPRRCVQCRRPGAWVCPDCLAGVHFLEPPLCECCGREIGASGLRRCQDCARERLRLDGIRAAARYEGPLRTALHRLKYNGHRAMASELAAFLAPVAPAADAIVPLPLHPLRQRARGYNQSELLAHVLGRRLGLPVLSAAQRVRETKDQIGLTRRQRQDNVKGAFACPRPALVAGRRVLLIDDVCTTGSTLQACAAPLLKAGALSVWGLVVARQDYERT